MRLSAVNAHLSANKFNPHAISEYDPQCGNKAIRCASESVIYQMYHQNGDIKWITIETI